MHTESKHLLLGTAISIGLVLGSTVYATNAIANTNTTLESKGKLQYTNPITGETELIINTADTEQLQAQLLETQAKLETLETRFEQVQDKVLLAPTGSTEDKAELVDAPIGHIINYMGTEAPAHYLICDGRELETESYYLLAEHIKDNFGSYNYFGGDGSKTFCLPDLRGEFLRGAGTNSHENQGSGADVGVHQDGTEHLYVRSDNGAGWIARNTQANTPNNLDNTLPARDTLFSTGGSTSGTSYLWPVSYTSRPTNTSVLYCIKYEPTYYMIYTEN